MDVVIYSKENCPYCDKIKTVFNIQNIKFVEYKLDQDFTRENFISEFGVGSTFPRVIIDGTLIGGASETVRYIQENNLV